MELKTAKGLALQDILTEIHTYIHKGKTWFIIYLILGFCFVYNLCSFKVISVFLSSQKEYEGKFEINFFVKYTQQYVLKTTTDIGLSI